MLFYNRIFSNNIYIIALHAPCVAERKIRESIDTREPMSINKKYINDLSDELAGLTILKTTTIIKI